MTDPSETAALRARIAELEQRVAWLEGELGLAVDDADLTAVRIAMNLGPTAARFGLILAKAHPRIVQKWVLEESMSLFSRKDDSEAMKVHIHRLRRALGPHSVTAVWGTGYRLSDEAAARIMVAARLFQGAA